MQKFLLMRSICFSIAVTLLTASTAYAQETTTSLTFPLSSDNTPVLVGNVRGGSEEFCNLKITVYSEIKAGSTADADGNILPNPPSMQCIRPEADGKTWIDTRDSNTYDLTQYVQFTVNAELGKYFLIEDFSFNYGLGGASGFGIKVFGSTDANFTNPVLLFETAKSITANRIYQATAKPNLCISWKNAYYVRIYPYIMSTATKIDAHKFFLSDVVFSGKGSDSEINPDNSGVETAVIDKTVSIEYYDLNGFKHEQPVKGLNIIRTTNANGNQSVNKVIL